MAQPKKGVKTSKKEARPQVNVNTIMGEVQMEGVNQAEARQFVEQVVEAAAEQLGDQYDAMLEGVMAERDAQRERADAAETQIEGLEAQAAESTRQDEIAELYDELAVPEAARERFTQLFNKEGQPYSVEAVKAFLESYMGSVGLSATKKEGKKTEDDVPATTQTVVAGKDSAKEGREFARDNMNEAQRERLAKRDARRGVTTS